MVFSLPCYTRGCSAQHRPPYLYLQVQDSGWQVYVSLPENIPNLMFGRDAECLAQIGQTAEEKELVGGSKYKEMFRLKALHTLALFILVYVGVEVTIGGKSRPMHCRAVLTTRSDHRLDCDLYDSCSPRWAIIWVYINWILWR